jgi:hypothetical protein
LIPTSFGRLSAIDESKNAADFSAFNEQVELAAPGVGVLSTIPGGQYAFLNCTSMACSQTLEHQNRLQYPLHFISHSHLLAQ